MPFMRFFIVDVKQRRLLVLYAGDTLELMISYHSQETFFDIKFRHKNIEII